MGLVRVLECDDSRPEYGLLLLRDTRAPEGLRAGDLPRGHGDGSSPAGTFAGAGAGWVAGQAGTDCRLIRLELHDSPPDGLAGFGDVLETPYHAGAGGLALSTLTGGAEARADIELGDATRFRARIARRADTWLLQFWPEPTLAPPVWLARSVAAVGAGDDGWSSVLPHPLMQDSYVIGNVAAEHGGWLTADQLDAWWRTHHGPTMGLDQPLRTRPAALDRLDQIAAELGVRPVRTRRDGLPLLVAAGILVQEEPDRYRAGRPAPVHTVLSLPPDRVRQLRQSHDRSRFHGLADDVLAVLRWAPDMPWETDAASLAARLLVDEADLRGALAYAEETDLLYAESRRPLRLSLGRRP